MFSERVALVGSILNIDQKRIYANEISFDKNKNDAGFDENELTSDSGSKDVGIPTVMGLLNKQGHKNLIIVGDGTTDLEASSPFDAFIGFGGNQIREAVRARADCYVTDFEVWKWEKPIALATTDFTACISGVMTVTTVFQAY